MAAKKTFKIGEYAVGGIITAEIKGRMVLIKALDWTTKKEVSTGSADAQDFGAERKIDNYLNDLTSSYYADKVLTWIKSKITLN